MKTCHNYDWGQRRGSSKWRRNGRWRKGGEGGWKRLVYAREKMEGSEKLQGGKQESGTDVSFDTYRSRRALIYTFLQEHTQSWFLSLSLMFPAFRCLHRLCIWTPDLIKHLSYMSWPPHDIDAHSACLHLWVLTCYEVQKTSTSAFLGFRFSIWSSFLLPKYMTFFFTGAL